MAAGSEVQHPSPGLAAGGLRSAAAHHVCGAHIDHDHQTQPLLRGRLRGGVLALRPQLDVRQVCATPCMLHATRMCGPGSCPSQSDAFHSRVNILETPERSMKAGASSTCTKKSVPAKYITCPAAQVQSGRHGAGHVDTVRAGSPALLQASGVEASSGSAAAPGHLPGAQPHPQVPQPALPDPGRGAKLCRGSWGTLPPASERSMLSWEHAPGSHKA